MEPKNKNSTPEEAVRIIDALGGTADASRLAEVTMSAVSQWKRYGIPWRELRLLRLLRPDVFGNERRKSKPCAGVSKQRRRKEDQATG